MELSTISKQKLRRFSICNPCYHLLETLVSAKTSTFPILSSNQFHTEPTSYPSISSSGSPSFCSIKYPVSHSSHFNAYNGCRSQRLKLCFFASYSRYVSMSSIVSGRNSPYATPSQVSEIIELVKSCDNEMESKLYSMNVSLSIASLIEIFRVLNCDKVSALRFFYWIADSQPEFYANSDICSLVIANCGGLDDYETMRSLLKEFSVKQVWLNEKAFGFLPVMILSKALTRKHISKAVEVLNEVGGSCRVSGVRALVEVFSVLGSFEMAKYVMKKTERKVSYYNILIRELCRRCDFKGARDMLDDMRRLRCDPNAQSYNYILSSLCKHGKFDDACELFGEMQKKDCPPDTVTYEIFIYGYCRFGKFSVAFRYFDEMVVRGLGPRPSTHAAFIKGYFNLQRYEDAYKYVIGSADKYKTSSNMMYSLLASLHDKNRNPVMAKNILLEMIKKGLRPNFSVYRRVLKHLQMSGREDLAAYLTNSFSSLSLPSSVDAA